MISKSFPIQAFIALAIIASSLTSSVNAAPRQLLFLGLVDSLLTSNQGHAPIVDVRQQSQQELDADAMKTCVPQSNPYFSCFNATLTPDSSGTIPFDTCANSALPGPPSSLCLRDCDSGIGSSDACFQGLCPTSDTATIDCLNRYFSNIVNNSN